MIPNDQSMEITVGDWSLQVISQVGNESVQVEIDELYENEFVRTISTIKADGEAWISLSVNSAIDIIIEQWLRGEYDQAEEEEVGVVIELDT